MAWFAIIDRQMASCESCEIDHLPPSSRYCQGGRCIRWQKFDWLALIIVCVVALLSFLPGLGDFGILDPSDGYYAEGGREMLETGDYLTPHLNYEPFFDKPILNYWLIVGAYKLWGVSPFAARLPAAFCAALIAILMYVFARLFVRRRAALLSSLALLSMPLWLVFGHMSLTDMPLSCFVWTALGSFYLAIEKGIKWTAWLGYIAVGLGMLTKGPLAAFLVVAILVIYLQITRGNFANWCPLFKSLFVLPGTLLALAIAAPWYFAENAATHGDFFKEFFLKQNLDRAMGVVDHKAGPLYYIPFFFGGTFPWCLFIFLLTPLWLRDPIRKFKSAQAALTERDKLTIFSITSTAFIFLFFSILPTKLDSYILPAMPSVAMITGLLLDKLLRLENCRSIELPAALMFVSCLLLAIVLTCAAANFIPTSLPEHSLALVQDFLISTDSLLRGAGATAMFLLAAAAAILLFGRNRLRQATTAFIVASILGLSTAVPIGIILAYQDKCRDFHTLLMDMVPMGVDAVMFGRRSPSASFYLHRRVEFALDESALLARVTNASPGTHFLLSEPLVKFLAKHGQNLSVVKTRDEWELLNKK